MSITLPNIEVIFKQLADTLIERSERGIAILIIKDETDTTFNYKEYQNISSLVLDEDLYTPANYQYISDIFNFALNKVVVVRINVAGTMASALAIVEGNIKTGWITVAGGTSGDFDALAVWTKAKEVEKKTYKAVTYKTAVTDCKHVVNFYNDTVTFVDARGVQTGSAYCPSLIGILASCNVKRGSTYYKCTNLVKVQEVADNNAAVVAGRLVLINDVDIVKIALGINSMTTIDGNLSTEDMKFIDIVEVMDLINDDVSSVFKDEYLGSYKNNYDNQIILISAINTYFERLAEDYILDNEYENKVDVDVESQRQAWLGIGKTEASTWSEAIVKKNAFKRTIFLFGDVKILGSMENLKFNISMF